MLLYRYTFLQEFHMFKRRYNTSIPMTLSSCGLNKGQLSLANLETGWKKRGQSLLRVKFSSFTFTPSRFSKAGHLSHKFALYEDQKKTYAYVFTYCNVLSMCGTPCKKVWLCNNIMNNLLATRKKDVWYFWNKTTDVLFCRPISHKGSEGHSSNW